MLKSFKLWFLTNHITNVQLYHKKLERAQFKIKLGLLLIFFVFQHTIKLFGHMGKVSAQKAVNFHQRPLVLSFHCKKIYSFSLHLCWTTHTPTHIHTHTLASGGRQRPLTHIKVC